MQGTAGGGGGGGSGGVNELSRVGGGGGAGLARFRSAPATWLDALLDDDDPLKLSGNQHQGGGLTQLLTAGTIASGPSPSGRASSPYIQPDPDPEFFDGGGGSGVGAQTTAAFQRMNSSPAEFLSGNVDGYFSSFGIPTSYEYV